MKKYLTRTLFIIIYFCLIIKPTFSQPLSEEQISIKVDSVLSLMTLDEKIGQLNQLSYGSGWGPTVKVQVSSEYEEMIKQGKIGSFLNATGAELTYELQKIAVTESRLKIPLIFGLDVIHGFRTTFPVPIAQASSWEPLLAEMSARYQSLEASSAGIHWTFAPMIDIARDPRWGRIVEGSGEDTYLGSLMSAAYVRGYQGDLSSDNIIACAKHFAAYGNAEGGRDYNTVDISERTLRDIFLPPFKAAVDAGAETFMASFNEINGIPSSGSKFLLTNVLRNEWGFKGFVVSDWNSIGEMINHGYADGLKDAGRISLNAGLDMDMESRSYISHLSDLLKENKIQQNTIDESVKKILRIKFLLGLFDDPFKYCSKERESKNIMNEEVQNAALEVAKRSIVLLKNENNLLPLDKDLKKIAVIGPLAESKEDPLGAWATFGNSEDVVTVVEGLKKYVSEKTEILYSKGCEIDSESTDGFDDAIKTANESDLVILCLGERSGMSGEASNRSSLNLPGVQQKLVEEIYKTGRNIVVILMNGRPLSIEWIDKNIPAIVEAWFLGIKSGDALAQVLFGDYSPSGKLPVTFPRTVGQVPIYYNHKSTGRPGNENNHYTSRYLDLPLTPLYPFGYGLSYTKFDFSNLKLSSDKISDKDKLTISVKVKNIGDFDGEETVQLYIQDLVGTVTRPVKELKRFEKIFLKQDEEKEVSFTISEEDLRFTGLDNKPISEAGNFKVFVGNNSRDVIESKFELIK
ncbi:MAG TPA: glycoside hydrolase family 3 N-terminal domain-containing protein [Ignavibacteriaceae bacterium]|nr:glycoside hydrolase family 3 N-terminal domain-containing protein [Ignavibacteriaceae bacterium]